MPEPDREDNIAARPSRWRCVVRDGAAVCYRGARHPIRWSWIALVALFRLTLVAYFIFAALVLTLRYAILPHIDLYKTRIEHIAGDAIGRPLAIGALNASWSGLQPRLTLDNVVIRGPDGKPALSLPRVAAVFSWNSLLLGEVRFDQLSIESPDVTVRRDAGGGIWVAGLPIKKDKSDGAGMDWVLSQHEISIHGGRLRWRDELRGAPELALDNVNFVLRNRWLRHRFALQATPPATLAAPIDLRADFFHAPFAHRVSDVSRWNGELYADLRNTDLAAWKPYIDYPLQIDSGSGSVRAWLQLDRSKVENLTADLDLNNLSAQFHARLQPLNLLHVSGRVAAGESGAGSLTSTAADGMPTFGANGHRLALTDFSLQLADGLLLPPTSISETYVPAQRGRPEQFTITAKRIDLDTLAALAGRLPMAAAQQRLLADLAPKGTLHDFSAQWRGAYPDILSYRLRGGFEGLGLHAQPARAAVTATGKLPAQAARAAVPAMPGFENLRGFIDTDEKGGTLALDSTRVLLQLPMLHAAALPLDTLSMHTSWRVQKDQRLLVKVADLNFAQAAMAGALSGTHLMPLDGSGHGVADLHARIDRFDVRKLEDVLPASMNGPTRDWLIKALTAGTAREVTMNLQGDLDKFPFHPARAGEAPTGKFTVAGKFDDVTMNYEPAHFGKDGKGPMWPLLEKLSGDISVDRTRLDIHAVSGVTHGAAVSEVRAAIPDLLNDATLELSGTASGALQDLVNYVNDSPVQRWTGNITEETRATGDGKLTLKLNLPLHHGVDARVNGALQFASNDVMLEKIIPTLYKTRGTLEFNEKGFNLNGVKANFLGDMASMSGGTQRDGTIQVKIDGNATAEGLRRAYPEPVMQRLLARVNGASRYTATVALRQHHLDVAIDSTLQGMAVDLPAPLSKPAAEALPLHVQHTDLSVADALLQHDELRVAVGPLTARYLRQKPLDRHADWSVQSGVIGMNRVPAMPASGLAMAIVTPALDLDAWRAFRTAISAPGEDATAELAAHAPPGAFDQYLMPDSIAARTDALTVLGKKLDNVVLDATRHGKGWNFAVESAQAAGTATWTDAQGGPGKVSARLSRLLIPRSAIADPKQAADRKETEKDAAKETPTQLPALDIVADNFRLFDKALGRLELDASNTRVAAGTQWNINKLVLANDDAVFTADGKWTVRGEENATHLNYAIDIRDAGKLLDRFGYEKTVGGGHGKVDGTVNWHGVPFAIDYPSLAGEVRLDVHAGQFLKVNPGAAKLLGVLNLQALPRRLALDFRDVFSQGFAFDSLIGSANIAAGIATTDNLKMTSVQASVLMDGAADIVHETQKLHVVVIPEFNLGTASVVAAVINPVIGVSSFLAQLFLRNPLMRSLTYEYDISGSWSEPVVTRLAHDKSAAAAAVNSLNSASAPAAP